jgi:voltage-gated potassium channel
MENNETNKDSALNYLNIIVLVLSIYILLALVADTFFKLPVEVSRLLTLLDDSICVFFIFEFCFRFYHAKNKAKFMQWGWIDLVSSIPSFPFLRMGRMFRLVRLLRILRAFRSGKHIIKHLFINKARGAFTTVSAVAVMMIIFSSVAILQVEHDPKSNIKTAEDAIWWAWVTITTVGYGDRYPVTTEGRIIASFLMTVGVGLFGTFTGFIASWFLEKQVEETVQSEEANKKRGTDNTEV